MRILAVLGDFWRWLGHTLATCLLFAFLLFGILLLFAMPSHAQSIFADGFETASEPGGPIPCPPTPAGYAEQTFGSQTWCANRPGGCKLQWSDFFYGAVFPFGKSYLSPGGAFTFRSVQPSTRGPSMAGKYIVIPFVPEAGSNYAISWLGPQAIVNAEIVYNPPRNNNGIFVTISACRGDFRPRVNIPAPDTPVGLTSVCRGFVRQGNLKFGTTGGVGQCPVTAGVEHYINIVFANPADGLLPNETSCVEGTRCEGNFDGL